jgi:hypothetical protein
MKRIKLSRTKVAAIATALTAIMGPDVAEKLRSFLLMVSSLVS